MQKKKNAVSKKEGSQIYCLHYACEGNIEMYIRV